MTRWIATLTAVLATLLCAATASAKTHQCVVPKITGLTLKTAEHRLHADGCKIGKVPRPDERGTLIVTRQSPKAHTRHKAGTKIKVWAKFQPKKAVKPTTTVTVPAPAATTTVTTPVSTPSQTTPAPITPAATAPATTTTPATPPVTPPTVRASIDPSYTQNQTNPLIVTWTYDAGVDDGSLPAGTLSLTIYQHGQVAAAGGCTIEVGAGTTGGTCTQTLPSFGSYDVTVSYTGSDPSVAPSSQTETEDIEPPSIAPLTITDTWPTDQPSITALVAGTTATVALTDSNFEGATTVGLTDQLGDTCTATVSGTTASCQMTVTGAPSSFTITYPGGTTVQATQTVSPYGIAQTQDVTTVWPAESYTVTNPTVDVQGVTLQWSQWLVTGGHTQTTAPPSTIDITLGQSVYLGVWAEGSLADDQYALGTISYTVTPDTATLTDDQPSVSTDCTASGNYSGQAVGYCTITPQSPGVYQVIMGYTSTDSNYGSLVNGENVLIDVQ